MSYYGGDFYRGDFYPGRGDPGIFGFLGGIAKKAVGFIPGVGPALSTALSMIPSGGSKATAAMANATSSLVRRGTAAVVAHPVISAAGAAGAAGLALGAGGAMMAAPGAMVAGAGRKGYHLSKARKVYGVVHPPHLVRNRRMNVCNPRALRRSIRRAHGFAKLAMKTIHIVHPKKKGRFGGFRRRRTRARS